MKNQPLDSSARTENALSWLRLCLDRKLELMTEDDIFNAPADQVDALLDHHGINRAEISHDIDASAHQSAQEAIGAKAGIAESPTWIVPRPDFSARVLESIASNTVTVVGGASCRGRSTFWRQELSQAKELNQYYWPQVVIDCCALRMVNAHKIEEEAIRAIFGTREGDCARFLSGLKSPDDRPLHAYIASKLYRNSGLIVLDHAECLSLNRSGEVAKWIEELVEWCDARGVKLLILWSGVFHKAARRAFCNPALLEMPLLSSDEISSWWAQSHFIPCRRLGLSAKEIHRVTGGSVRLLRDFGRFVEDVIDEGGSTSVCLLSDFEEVMARSYAPEIERVMAVVRRKPILIEQPERAARFGLQDELFASGAFETITEKQANFASPILERRFKAFSRGRGARALMQLGTVFEVLADRHLQEACAANLNNTLLSMKPTDVFRALETVFFTMASGQEAGFDRIVTTISLRDTINPKLWSDIKWRNTDEDVKIYPLYAEHSPEFAKAIHTGRVVEIYDGSVLFPVVTDRGMVGAVITLRLPPDPCETALSRFRRRLLLRALWRMSLAIQPALSVALERHAARNESRRQRRFLMKSASANSLDHLLRSFGCESTAILQRGRCGWMLASYNKNAVEGEECSFEIDDTRLDFNNVDRLDAIHTHESGVVLVSRELNTIFERMEWPEDTSVFAVRGHEKGRLHLFIFAGKYARRLDGYKQSELMRFSHERELFSNRI